MKSRQKYPGKGYKAKDNLHDTFPCPHLYKELAG